MTTITSVINRLNRRKDEAERGFSLIELIIVIVILGILVAIAIPVYNNIQKNAKTNAVKTAAANGASQAVSSAANSSTAPTANTQLTNLESGNVTYVAIAKVGSSATDSLCVVASATLPSSTTTAPTTQGSDTDYTWFAGPGANSAGTGCTS